jgi:membrane-bound lytic murein transglycosylase A
VNSLRSFAGAAALLMLSACAGGIVPPAPPQSAGNPQPNRPAPVFHPTPHQPVAPAPVTASIGPTARSVGVFAAPAFETSPIDSASAARALKAFRISCPSLTKRNDQSGLTRATDWQTACAAAADWPQGDARGFFVQNFEMVQVGDGKSYATGYFEPEIAGARTRSAGFEIPVYRRPPDLAEVDLGQFSDLLKGKKIRGKVSGNSFVPFDDRTAIEEGALAGRGLELAWAADAAEFFFLQVQGSGRLKLPDGSVMRIGYDGQNGRDYTGIGKLMKERGLLGPGQTSMQGIVQYLHDHPGEGQAIMRENKSWIFFKEVTGAGPLGALGLPVSGHASVAADPAFVPLGAPVLLSMDRADATGLWIAQDTGGAIKGANRFDTFWGAGAAARTTAGGMSARGTAFILLPKNTRARIRQEQADAGTSPAP